MRPVFEAELPTPGGKPTAARVHLATEAEMLAAFPRRAAEHAAFVRSLSASLTPEQLGALRALDEPLAAWARQSPERIKQFLADPLGALDQSGVPVSSAARAALAALRRASSPEKSHGDL